MRRALLVLLTTVAAAAAMTLGGSSARASDAQDLLITHEDIYGLPVPATTQDQADGLTGPGGGNGPGQQGKVTYYCGTNGEAAGGLFDKDISCDDAFAPDNETPISADPANPQLLLAGSNDYQLNFVGATVNEQVPSGWNLSEDGGRTWLDGNLPMKGSLGGGDPVPGFDDKHKQLVFASLSFVCGQLAPLCSRGNIEFASAPFSQLSGDASKDNVNFSDQTIYDGNGSDAAAQQNFLDKLWMAVDNNKQSPGYGNIYVTFTKFRFESGAYDESPIWFIYSTDGGKSWSQAEEISGRNPRYCNYQADSTDPDKDNSKTSSTNATAETADDPKACDEDQDSYPYVAPDGTVYVTFQNEQNWAAWELPQTFDDQTMVVRGTYSPTTKQVTFSGEAPTAANQAGCVVVPGQAPGTPAPGFANPCTVPVHIANLEDSNDNLSHVEGGPTAVPDFPLNVDGRLTLTGHQFRYSSSSNLVAAKRTDGGTRVFVFWSDNAAGIIPGSSTTPGTLPITNTNVYYAYSDDNGNTWTGGDQGLTSLTPDVPGSGPLCTTGACPELATRLAVPSASTNAPDSTNAQCGVCSDQFYPFADANPATGQVGAGWMEGGFGAPRTEYGFALSTTGPQVAGVPPTWSAPTVVSSVPSNPNQSRFFRAGSTADPECGDCATFIGDYNGFAYGSDGTMHGTWTDMRRPLAFVDRPVGCGTDTPCVQTPLFAQDVFYARIPRTGP